MIIFSFSDFRLRFAEAEWEKERDGWRSVVQLNVVRSITTIQKVIEAEINGEVPVDSDDDDSSTLANDVNEIEPLKFNDRHQLLLIRLAPLNGVEAELKRRLGAGSEPLAPAVSPLSATPFEEPRVGGSTRNRKKLEFSVRSWREVLDPDLRQIAESSKQNSDSVTQTIAGCKDDMKALWEDRTVRLALKRRGIQLNDTAGLYAIFPCISYWHT